MKCIHLATCNPSSHPSQSNQSVQQTPISQSQAKSTDFAPDSHHASQQCTTGVPGKSSEVSNQKITLRLQTTDWQNTLLMRFSGHDRFDLQKRECWKMEAYFLHKPFMIMMSQVSKGNHPFSDQFADP